MTHYSDPCLIIFALSVVLLLGIDKHVNHYSTHMYLRALSHCQQSRSYPCVSLSIFKTWKKKVANTFLLHALLIV